MEFDRLKMYFGEPYVVQTPGDRTITVLQPTIGDIIKIGEGRFYTTLQIFLANTTMYRAHLWSCGIDWNQIGDFDLFLMIFTMADPEVIEMLFDHLDLSGFQLNQMAKEDGTTDVVLRNDTTGVVIDRDVYEHIHRYLQEMFKMKPEDEKTDNQHLKEWWVRKDQIDAAQKAKKSKDDGYSMQALISSAVNHPGFKYKLQELRDVGVCEFYDSIQRLQLYENATAVLKGMYSGMVDGSKIKPETYNWMKAL